jgi:hypothetical protein
MLEHERTTVSAPHTQRFVPLWFWVASLSAPCWPQEVTKGIDKEIAMQALRLHKAAAAKEPETAATETSRSDSEEGASQVCSIHVSFSTSACC